jgi:two-component system, OmpR family, aerobic respiration control sensor histidine kinase ArcB
MENKKEWLSKKSKSKKLTDDSLEEEIFYLQSIINMVPASIYWKNNEGVYLGGNAFAAEKMALLGLETKSFPNKVLGKTDYDFFPKEVADKYRANDLKVIQHGQEIVEEEILKLPSGKEIIQLSIKKPLYNKKGEIVGIVGNILDITNRKETEKLQTEKNTAIKALEMIEMLSASIAFEMRSAMAVIGINADNLKLALDMANRNLNSPTEHENINTIYDNIKYSMYKSETNVNMLLTKVSHVIAGKIDSKDFELQSIKNTINNVIKEYPFLEKEKKLVHWGPKANEDFRYFGRESLTKNVLFNLIKNALHAIKEYDKGEIFITLGSDKKFNYLIFKDTGMGIPEKNLANLFQKLHEHTYGGLGFSLAFCKMVMNSYNGDITCKSVEGKFTEFTLSFPKQKDEITTTLKQKIMARLAVKESGSLQGNC